MDGFLPGSFFRPNARFRCQPSTSWSVERLKKKSFLTRGSSSGGCLSKTEKRMNFPHLFENDFYAILPELYLILSTLVLLLFGVFYSTSKKHNTPSMMQTVAWLGLFCLFCTLCILQNLPFSSMTFLYSTLVMDPLTFFFKTLVLLGAGLSLFISLQYFQTEDFRDFEYTLLLLFSTCSMLLLVSASDFISMYLAIEMQSLCLYVLAASKRNSEFSTEAGLKYFLLGAFSSGILLFGCSVLYGLTGLTGFESFAKLFSGVGESLPVQTQSFLSVGILFIAVGFLFKLTAAPFHFWAPDVYEGAPTSVTAFFSITPKLAIMAVFLRLFLVSFYDFLFSWQSILILSSLFSLLIGSFGAVAQTRVKRLLVYSSIGHMGYLLMGVASGTVEGLQSVLLYLCIYSVITVNIFAIVLSLRDQQTGQNIKYIEDMSMLSKSHPLLAFSLTLTLFSMAGIPPLAGFCSKFYLFFAALSSSLYFLAVFGIFSSMLSCFYYLRVIKTMYFDQSKQPFKNVQMDHEKSWVITWTTFFVVFFFLHPNVAFLWTQKVALLFLS
jgi:proton-translocating NADH-quinone oxidoreductase chain N